MSDMSVNDPLNPEGVDQQHDHEAGQPRQSPGAQLAALREARGWSVEQVANQLNLAPRQIHAIETDNHAALPGMVIVRGFIRAYAKLLKTDAAPLLAMIAGENDAPAELPPIRNTLSASFSETRLMSRGQRRFPVKLIGGLVFLVAIAALVVLGGQRMGWTPGLPGSLSVRIEEELALMLPAKSSETQSAVAEDAVQTTVANETSAAPAASIAITPEVAAPIAPNAPVAEQPAVPATPAPATGSVVQSSDLLALHMREDSWVEIKRGDNSVLFSRLVKAGASETFEVAGPMSVTIGNAAGVDATLRGAPLDLKSGTNSNVARLNVK